MHIVTRPGYPDTSRVVTLVYRYTPKQNSLEIVPLFFKLSAHLAVIDALMSAFAMETMSSVKISVGGAETDSGSAPSKLQPVPWEYAILFWVNKCPTRWYWKLVPLIHKLQEGTEREQTHRHPPGTDLQTQPSCPTRWYWKLVPIRYRKDKMMTKQTPTFPAVTGVKDLSNGCAIAAAVHHYCPDILRLEDVCLKETMSVADSLYNLQLIQEFCQECLGSCCPLALEDLLYTPPVLKRNIMTFMAELFWWFEIRKPEFVNPKEPLDLEDVSGMNECTSPTSGNSNSGSPAFIFRQPFLPLASPQSPSRSSPGSLNQSTSMPHVESIGRTWTKKQRRPLSQEVSFSIPFGLDSDVEVVMGNPVLSSSSLVRSVSSDSLNPSVFQGPQTITHATYTPPADMDGFLRKHPAGKNGPLGPQRATWSTQTPATLGKMKAEREGLENGLPDDLPTIEEAMQIIHNEGTLEPRLHPEGAPDEFYLHSPYILEDSRGRLDGSPSRLSCSAPSHSGMMHRVPGEVAAAGLGFPSEQGWRQQRTSEGSRISRDDDSVLRDNSLDSDEEFPKQQQQPKQDVRDGKDDCPSGLSSQPDSSNSNQDSSTSTGVRMTSFAERKKKLSTSETPKDPAEPQMVTSAQKCEESPRKSPALNTEMSQLGARLEEKRRAIEAQKKRIEAIFAKHRQRLGKSAFLQLKREGDPAEPQMVTSAQKCEESPGKSPALNTEMSQLGARLEEKRRAIEAQKKRIEAIFAKHRQRLGKSAFLQLKREGGGGGSDPEGEEETPKLSLEERLSRIEDEEELDTPSPLGTLETPDSKPWEPKSHPEKQVTFSPEIGKEKLEDEAHLGEYNKAVSKLNAALSSLQSDMQRLSDQQKQLMHKKPATKAWDEARPEDEMAQRRAALLEKQQKRAEEVKKRKQWQELDSKPAGEVGEVKEEKPEQPSRPVEKGARRGDFTRQEYERRHQLKIMEDLDKVLRQKPTTVRGVKKQRPKTVFRDDSVLSRSPVKGYLGSRLSKVYSHSTLSLSTMASDTGKKSPRAQSPSGLKSPSRLLSNQNGEDWENTSTASSPASIPEYTGTDTEREREGERQSERERERDLTSLYYSLQCFYCPKLYKEPSLKSNKFIIHNALSRCCLAGRVNEAQKNKILEEMEKSKANHFLILFRDASCQFRAVYSMNPETEEMQRVAGIGPRVISLGMVEGIFKYSSDRKQFTPIPSKTMSMSVDAVTIQGHLWQSKRPGTPKKPGTPK
ncbi:UNVERIFIED_CONTAM: hypothetical protein FKN15_029688 [Acipenser sinensis]